MAGYSGTPLVRKIGIKLRDRVLLLNAPRGFDKELAPLPAEVAVSREQSEATGQPVNVTICFPAERKELQRALPRLKTKMAQDGMIWVGWRKKASGLASDLNENLIRDAGVALGLVDVKVCAINEIWSGLKFVIPVKDRK